MARGWLKALEGPAVAFAGLVDTNNNAAIRFRDETGLGGVRIETAGRRPETVGADDIKSLAMVFAAVESARTRTRQTIEALP